MYVTKKIHEFPYLDTSAELVNGEVHVIEALAGGLPKTRIMVLEEGRIAFIGSLKEFESSNLPAIKQLATLDTHDHSVIRTSRIRGTRITIIRNDIRR